MGGLCEVFEVTASSVEGGLNTPGLFSLGGELALIFSFLVEEIATKTKSVFIVLSMVSQTWSPKTDMM